MTKPGMEPAPHTIRPEKYIMPSSPFQSLINWLDTAEFSDLLAFCSIYFCFANYNGRIVQTTKFLIMKPSPFTFSFYLDQNIHLYILVFKPLAWVPPLKKDTLNHVSHHKIQLSIVLFFIFYFKGFLHL